MEKACTCPLCGETMNGKQGVCLNCRARLTRAGVSLKKRYPRHTDCVILLIGLEDQEAVRRQLSELGVAAFILCARNTQEAKGYLQNLGGELFFLLDAAMGEPTCLDFLEWLLEHRPTYGAIIGDSISNTLAIDALNSFLVVDALPRPVSVERWRRLLERYIAAAVK